MLSVICIDNFIEHTYYFQIIAHEIGHNLGLRHDFDVGHGGNNKPSGPGHCNRKGIMSYGNGWWANEWSSCSKKDFKTHYNVIRKYYDYEWCMEGKYVAKLLGNKRFALNEMFQRNASKFAIIYVQENPRNFFCFVFHFVRLYFFPYECPGLCQHRPGHS